MIEYFIELCEKYAFVPIDKAASNIAIICKKFYLTVTLKEIEILEAVNETYEKINKNQKEIVQDTIDISNFPMEVKIKVCQ